MRGLLDYSWRISQRCESLVTACGGQAEVCGLPSAPQVRVKLSNSNQTHTHPPTHTHAHTSSRWLTHYTCSWLAAHSLRYGVTENALEFDEWWGEWSRESSVDIKWNIIQLSGVKSASDIAAKRALWIGVFRQYDFLRRRHPTSSNRPIAIRRTPASLLLPLPLNICSVEFLISFLTHILKVVYFRLYSTSGGLSVLLLFLILTTPFRPIQHLPDRSSPNFQGWLNRL